jgi:two-component system alkaline phosphatase synthesis response regulator PhoP/two-component system response regulator ResD
VPRETILLVDDERHIVDLARMYLEQDGFKVEAAYDGQTALDKIKSLQPALVVLDLMLPAVDGWEVCRRVRSLSAIPIIMLTARDDDVDKIVGLELGADDYLTKPFNPRELVARIKAILRRSGHEPVGTKPITLGDLNVDPARREVTVAGRPVELRAQEFDLLLVLVENRGLVLSRDKLLELAWGYDFAGQTRTVDVHVAHLRDKLAGGNVQIETVWGVGYKLMV